MKIAELLEAKHELPLVLSLTNKLLKSGKTVLFMFKPSKVPHELRYAGTGINIEPFTANGNFVRGWKVTEIDHRSEAEMPFSYLYLKSKNNEQWVSFEDEHVNRILTLKKIGDGYVLTHNDKVKVTEENLKENSLTEFTEILALRKHGKLSREEAEKLASTLKSFSFHVGGKNVPANLRWKEDKLTGTLKFVTADMPGTWRSGPSAVSRGMVTKLLASYGFNVARFQSDAAKRQHSDYNGPHIFFWGKGTPPQDLTKLSKIAGTGEWRKQIEDSVKAQRKTDEAS